MATAYAFGKVPGRTGNVFGALPWKAVCLVALLGGSVASAAEPAREADGYGPVAADSRDGEIPYRSGQSVPAARPGEEWYLFMYPVGDPTPAGPLVTEKVRLPAASEAVGRTLPAVALPEPVAVTVKPAHFEGRVIPATFLRKSVAYEQVAAHHPGAVLKNEELSVVVAPAHVEREWRPARFEPRDLPVRAAATRRTAPPDGRGKPAEAPVPETESVGPEGGETVRVYDLVENSGELIREVPEKRRTLTVRVVEKDGDPALPLVPAVMAEYEVRELMEPATVAVSEIPAEIVWRRVYAELPEQESPKAAVAFRYVDFVRPKGPMSLRQLERGRIVWRKRSVPVAAVATPIEVRPVLTSADWEQVLGDAPAGGPGASIRPSIVFPREAPAAELAVGAHWPLLSLADTVDAALDGEKAMNQGMEHAQKGQFAQARPYWEFAAKRRVAEAWYRLGKGARDGVFGDGQPDPVRAEACWLAAARLGSGNAWIALGDLYATGLLGAPDWNRATDAWIEAYYSNRDTAIRTQSYRRLREFVQVRWSRIAHDDGGVGFERAAGLGLLRQNHPRLAGVFLGRIVNHSADELFAEALIAHNGWNAAGKPDYAEARSLLTLAAGRHHAAAKECLAVLMDDAAREALVRAADAGDLSAVVRLARYAYQFNDHVSAAARARQGIARVLDATSGKSDPVAGSVPAPGPEAFAEYAEALRILALTLPLTDPAWHVRRPETGLATLPTPEVRARLDRTGLVLLERAALLGDVEALYQAGDAYRYGKRGVAADPERAFAFFGQAAVRDDPRALVALAELFADGGIGAPDPVRAYGLAAAVLQRPGLDEDTAALCQRIQFQCGRRLSAKRLAACAAQGEYLRRAADNDSRARALDQILWRSEGFLPQRPTVVKPYASEAMAVPVVLPAGDGHEDPTPDAVPFLILPLPEASPWSGRGPVPAKGVSGPASARSGDGKAPVEAVRVATALPVEQPFVSGRLPVAKPGERWQLFVYPALLFRRGEVPVGPKPVCKPCKPAAEPKPAEAKAPSPVPANPAPTCSARIDDGATTTCRLLDGVFFPRPVPSRYKDYPADLPLSAPYHVGTVIPARFESRTMTYEYRPAYRPGAEFVEREFEVVLRPAYAKKTWVAAEFSEPEEKKVTLTPARREWTAAAGTEGRANPVVYALREIPPLTETYAFQGVKADGRVETEEVEAETARLRRLELVKEGDPAQPLRPAQMAEYKTEILVEPSEVRIQEDMVKTRPVTVSRDSRESSFAFGKWPEVDLDVAGDIVAVEPARLVWRKVSAPAESTEAGSIPGTPASPAEGPALQAKE